MEGFGWTERIHELEEALKEANSRTFQYSAKVDEKSEEISILEKLIDQTKEENVGLIVENQRFKRELDVQKSIIDLSIEHELRGDQLTQAIAELKESMEQRMPIKRKKIKK